MGSSTCLTLKEYVTIHGLHYFLCLSFLFVLLSMVMALSLLSSKNILRLLPRIFLPLELFIKRCGYKK